MADRIDYIKESLDALHAKVDQAHVDLDERIRSLEETRAHQKGAMGALSLVSAVIGSLITLVASYFAFKS